MSFFQIEGPTSLTHHYLWIAQPSVLWSFAWPASDLNLKVKRHQNKNQKTVKDLRVQKLHALLLVLAMWMHELPHVRTLDSAEEMVLAELNFVREKKSQTVQGTRVHFEV